jgi:hypothetical protein
MLWIKFNVITLYICYWTFTFYYFTSAGVKCCVAAVKSCPVLHLSVVIFFWSFEIIDASTFKWWELSIAQAGARGVRDVAPHVQTQSNQVCITLAILLWLMLPRDHFLSRFSCLQPLVRPQNKFVCVCTFYLFFFWCCCFFLFFFAYLEYFCVIYCL